MRIADTWVLLIIVLLPAVSCADTLHVPGEWPSIQSAVDAAAVGDTVLVAPGVYAECVQLSCGVTLRGDPQSPDLVTIDGESSHRCVQCEQAGPAATIVGVTMRDGSAGTHDGGGVLIGESSAAIIEDCVLWSCASNSAGGGLLALDATVDIARCAFVSNGAWVVNPVGGGGVCIVRSAAVVEDCEFRANRARKGGGLAIYESTGVTVSGCTFEGNEALLWGGAVLCWESSATLSGCTLVANSGGTGGGGIGVRDNSELTVSNTVVAFSEDGPSISVGGAPPPLMDCCDIYGNAGGDWVDCIADQLGSNGNIEADPLFCGEAAPMTPYALDEASPCAPGASQCGLIGAWPVECGYAPVRETSWGLIKSMYR